jgi:DNA-binding transcriptional MerR regulator
MDKSADAFRTISEVAEELDVHKHVLRFWEVRFPQIKPMKRGGGRRYYRPADLELLRGIRHLLHNEGYTIKGVQKILREQGVDTVKAALHEAVTASAKPAAASKAGGRTGLAAGTKVRTARPASPRDRKAVIAAMVRELEAARAILIGKSAGKAKTASLGSARARR